MTSGHKRPATLEYVRQTGGHGQYGDVDVAVGQVNRPVAAALHQLFLLRPAEPEAPAEPAQEEQRQAA